MSERLISRRELISSVLGGTSVVSLAERARIDIQFNNDLNSGKINRASLQRSGLGVIDPNVARQNERILLFIPNVIGVLLLTISPVVVPTFVKNLKSIFNRGK